MKWEEILSDPKLWKMVLKKFLSVVAFTVILTFLLFHLDALPMVGGRVMSVIGPFLVGIAVAFVLNVLVRLFEQKVFARLNRKGWKVWDKIRRGVCILLAFAVVLVLLSLVIFFIIPELVDSLRVFSDNLPVYLKQFSDWLTGILSKLEIGKGQDSLLKLDWSKLIDRLTQAVTNFVTSILSITVSVASGVFSFIISIIFSIYMLYGKEKLIRSVRRVLYAFLPRERAQRLIAVGSLANRIFYGFVVGQMTEAAIIGVLCYLGMTVMRLPYALLISVIISLGSFIPILGAYLGGALGAFILLMIHPIYSLWFLIFLILLQQFEGNVIYPRVVGSSIGLPGIWVLLAILVCGNLFGIPGILIGVPACSVLYALLRQETELKLKEKRISEQEVMGPPPIDLPKVFTRGGGRAAPGPAQRPGQEKKP